MKILFCTHGCKVNQYETQSLRELFLENGFKLAEKGETPDVFLLNSCTVTSESDRKNRQMLRRIKKQYPLCITVLFGCMAQAFPEKAKQLGVDIVFGNTDHKKLLDLLNEFIKNRSPLQLVENHCNGEKYCTPGISYFEGRTRAYMKIEDGCNRFCSYCAIPYARGRVRSRSISEISDEAEKLAQNGYNEIVLVGINLSAYGQDTGDTLCNAVNAASAPKGIKRVRLGSLEPDHISDEILENLKKNEKFCPQFHLSLQSGSSATLRRMNRHYDAEFYRDLVKRIRTVFDNPSITTDVMVGFMGETEKEFLESLNFVKEIGFARCHVFAYSKREGTAAVKLSGEVPKATKLKRSEKMIEAAGESQQEFLQNQLESTQSVLFETVKNGVAEGYTENYTRVMVKTEKDISNRILDVHLKEIKEDYLLGELKGMDI